jgi:parallel beta-helix repeat protein
MLLSGSDATVLNCTFVGNSYGGAISLFDKSQALVAGCTFSNNVGGGIGSDPGSNSAATIANCVFWGNAPDQISGPAAVNFSDIQGGHPGAGNIDADPLFVRTPNDGGDGWGDDPSTPGVDEGANDDYGDLRLTAGSPCIDNGDPAFIPPPDAHLDLAGRVRIWDGDADGIRRVDMGAYEFGAPIPADLDNDCSVGLQDLAILLAYFGTPSGATYADGDIEPPNGDGDVDLSDLALVLGSFGSTCP